MEFKKLVYLWTCNPDFLIDLALPYLYEFIETSKKKEEEKNINI
jgi:hypothetical protein